MPSFFARATSSSDGVNVNYSIPFPYLQQQHVVIQARATADAVPVTLVQDVDYSFLSASIIGLTAPQPEGYLVDRIRESGISAPIVPFGGGTLTSEELQTNNLQLLYLVQEAEDLALATGGTTVIVTPPDGGGGGVTITTPRYGVATGTAGAWANLNVDEQGQLTEGFERHLWLDMFYTDDTTTDTQALLYFANLFNTGAIGDCTLNLMVAKGRGPAGRYIIDQEILFTGGFRLVINGNEAYVRYTTPTARLRYKPPQITGSSSITPTSFFVIRNVIFQYAAAIDCIAYWDFPYKDSRDMGTGYVENVRVIPQDNNNAGHTTVSTFRTKNTWYWTASRVHAKGPPRTAGSYVAGSSFLRQEGLCVVACLTDACELEFYDTAIIPGIAPLVGVNGTFSGGASYGRGKGLRQGANIAYLGRSDSFGGNGTYTLYDEAGTLVNGVCEVLDSTGAVTGSFTITSIVRFGQASEAIDVGGGTTIINGNYIINATSPNANTKFLDWKFHDFHCFLSMGAIKVDGLALLQYGPNAFNIVGGAGTTLLDITNGDNIRVTGLQVTSGDGSGDLGNVTVFKGRSITAGIFSANIAYLVKYMVDLNSTVKSFKVHGNSAYALTTANNPTAPVFLNTASRYNTTNIQGVDFKSNGLMGRGFDTDDNHMLAWNPTLSAQNGATITYTQGSVGGINVSDGVLTMNAKLNVTGIGTAATPTNNEMYISFPASLLADFGVPLSALANGFLVNARVSGAVVAAVYDAINNRILIIDSDVYRNTGGGSAWKTNNAAIATPFSIWVQASVPIQYD